MEDAEWISPENKGPRTNCLSLTRHGGTLFRKSEKNEKNENVVSDGNGTRISIGSRISSLMKALASSLFARRRGLATTRSKSWG